MYRTARQGSVCTIPFLLFLCLRSSAFSVARSGGALTGAVPVLGPRVCSAVGNKRLTANRIMPAEALSMSSRARSVVDYVQEPWSLSPGDAGAENPKVREVFEYLSKNPVTVGGSPMHYEPLEVMEKRIQRPFASSPAFDLKPSDFPCTPGNEDFRMVICGILQLACGGLDECHDYITPLSWEDGTLFGGAPIYGSPARADATLAHHLVHLREGQYPGEFGTGWNNAGFWAGSAGSHAVFGQVREAAAMIAAGHQTLENEIQTSHTPQWNLRAFIRSCSMAVETQDAELTQFCETVHNVSFRILFNYLWGRLEA